MDTLSKEQLVKIIIPINEYTDKMSIEIDGNKCIQFFTDNDADFINVPIGVETDVPEWVVKAAVFGGLL